MELNLRNMPIGKLNIEKDISISVRQGIFEAILYSHHLARRSISGIAALSFAKLGYTIERRATS